MVMDKKATFTNEKLSKKFKSNFELVTYAIELAENMIKTGRDARVKSDMQNRAMLVLEEILEGKDQFDEIPEHSSTRSSSTFSALEAELLNEERSERRKYKTSEMIEMEG